MSSGMARFYEIAKAVSLKWLPTIAVDRLKRAHYLNKVRSVPLSEEPDLEIVKSLVDDGNYVVDIGANIGVYTVFLSGLVKETGRVYSFEPVPSTFSYLHNSITKLGLSNVIARQIAITEGACRIRMAVPKDDRGVANFYQAAVVPSGSAGGVQSIVEVDALSLDEALSDEVGRIGFIKCDVEGHELYCLHGAKKTLRFSRSAWLIEVSGDPRKAGSNAARVFQLMTANGYSAWVFRHGKLEQWSPGILSVNYFFLRSEHLERLRRNRVLPQD
jgi:FkbM family methyltransferase